MAPKPQNTETEPSPGIPIDQVIEHLRANETEQVNLILGVLHAAEIASLLESLPQELRTQLWDLLPTDCAGDVLTYVGEEVRARIISKMADAEVVAATEGMEVADLVDVIEELPQALGDTIIQSLDDDRRHRLEETRAFAEGSVGRWMSPDVISVRKDVSLAVVLRYLRFLKPLPPHTDSVLVIDEQGVYQGKLYINDAVTESSEALVEEVMIAEADYLRADAAEHDIAVVFERRDLISAAVIDEQGKLLGRITVDHAVDIIRAEADKSVMAHAGLSEEEDLFAPAINSAKRRAVWLGVNLITVFLAAWVIGQFEEVLDKIVALAVLMPVVASMGGIAGSQTLTLTIRGLALGQLSPTNLRWLGNKELAVGLLNGVAWAIVVAGVTFLWFNDIGIALIIAAATVLNLIAASISGVVIPFVLDRMGIDPALSGAVVLTTVTDIVGFLSFLGLATLFLI
ncbi:MAG: magnesium transporter [Candidatus Thiodiazotropha sp. 6PDIVS]